MRLPYAVKILSRGKEKDQSCSWVRVFFRVYVEQRLPCCSSYLWAHAAKQRDWIYSISLQ